MKLKNLVLSFSALLGLALVSCSKKNDPAPTVTPKPADSVTSTFSGGILGSASKHSTFTFLSGQTYNITKANVIIINADVVIQSGAKILFGGTEEINSIGFYSKNNNLASTKRNSNTLGYTKFAVSQTSTPLIYSFYIQGGSSLDVQGTKDGHVTFSTSNPNPTWPNGYWGGINCDSTTTSVKLEWTDISYTGGADSVSSNQYAFYVGGKKSSSTSVIIENSSIQYGVDDCTRLEGNIKVAIRGNIFKRQGTNDGDGINIKSGVTGDVCYNYIFAGANNSIKLNANLLDLSLNTNVNIYNNTIIEGGWRKVGEAASGILIDANAKGTCFNNLILNCRNGITITSVADILFLDGPNKDQLDKHVNNNFIYALSDSVAEHSYGTTDTYSTKRSNDISAVTFASQTNQPIVSFDANALGYTDQDNSYPDKNDPYLLQGSTAKGKGNTSATYNNQLNYGPQWAPGEDIGAFQITNTSKGNLRGSN